jgi:hypothetical protein
MSKKVHCTVSLRQPPPPPTFSWLSLILAPEKILLSTPVTVMCAISDVSFGEERVLSRVSPPCQRHRGQAQGSVCPVRGTKVSQSCQGHRDKTQGPVLYIRGTRVYSSCQSVNYTPLRSQSVLSGAQESVRHFRGTGDQSAMSYA